MLVDLVKEFLEEEGYETEEAFVSLWLPESRTIFCREPPADHKYDAYGCRQLTRRLKFSDLTFIEYGDTLEIAGSRYLKVGEYPPLRAAKPCFLDQVKYLIDLHARNARRRKNA